MRGVSILVVLLLWVNHAFTQLEVEIDPDTLTENERVVYDFLNALSNRDFRRAYSLSANPNWGSYSFFASNKGFGGISKVVIFDLKELGFYQDHWAVYARAYYRDTVNGSHVFSQIFKIKNLHGKSKIVGMNLLKMDNRLFGKPREGFYQVKVGEGGMKITSINPKKKSFDFNISIICPTNHTAEADGTAYLNEDHWEFRYDGEFPCKLDFYFFGKQVLIDEISCSDWHGARCFFDYILTYKSQ